jgi:organic hydroperoxide reductase OsmC/OhrA
LLLVVAWTNMAGRTHSYQTNLRWVGAGVAPFQKHDRSYEIECEGKPTLLGSSDQTFRGNRGRWNPEDLLVASLSACHHLWYMGLCAAAGIEVKAYEDAAEGEMVEEKIGERGQFTRVTLRPRVTLARGADKAKAKELHHAAHESCFIARSVNFPVHCEPTIEVE